ncbi:MAG: AbrB/MazE/SpoVT family DNA-binding domain-containing protein [Rhizobium sp.]|nr:AbrB/MazE/SpoVT family DNA-binding domain-containing protein [Rhizobium sp.]
MGVERQIPLERDGDGQTVHIPLDLALPGEAAVISKLGDGLFIRPAEQKKTSDLLDWLKTIEPWDEEFPDVDEGLLPLEDVEL